MHPSLLSQFDLSRKTALVTGASRGTIVQISLDFTSIAKALETARIHPGLL